MRVLVVRAGALGDTLMVTPLLRCLHQAHPDSEIDLLCSEGGAALLEGNPHVSQFLVLRGRNLPFFLSPEKHALVHRLRERAYHFAILLESAAHYRELLTRAGIREIRSFRETPFDPLQHSVVNNIAAARLNVAVKGNLDLELFIDTASREWASALLGGLPYPRIGLHAGYGPAAKKKRQTERLRGWSTENFNAVARRLTQSGASVVLTGAAEDVPTCREIAQALPPAQVRITAGQATVAQTPALLSALDLLLSVDSGPAHIAAAVGTPLVVLWGPGILAQTRPLSSTTPLHILHAGVPCAPCYGTPLMKACRNNICMQQLTPEQALTAARQLLPALRPLADSAHVER